MTLIRNKEYSYIALKKVKYITYNDLAVRGPAKFRRKKTPIKIDVFMKNAILTS